MTRFGALVERVDERGRGVNLPLMSVSQTLGVVRRSELTQDAHRADSLDEYKVCRSGDIVFNKMSIRDGAMGVAREDGLVTYHYEVMRPIPGADPRYVVYLMKSEWFTGELIKRERGIGAGGTSGVRTTEVPFSVLRTIDTPIVDSEAQRTIADYLDLETKRIDTTIELRRSLAGLQTERLTAGIAEVLRDEPRRRLGTVLMSIEQGWSPTAADITRDDEDAWAVLKLSAVTGGTYRPQHHKVLDKPPGANARYEVRAGDLLMTRANTPQLVGDVAYVPSTPRRLLIPDLVYRLGYHADRADGRYLAFALRTPEVRGQLAAIARGSSQSMVKLRAEDIKALTLALPALTRQRRLAPMFIALAESGAATQRAMHRQTDLLLERRQALVTAAVTGQLGRVG